MAIATTVFALWVAPVAHARAMALVTVQPEHAGLVGAARNVCTTVTTLYGLSCSVEKSGRRLPGFAPQRHQLDARAALEHVFEAREPAAWVHVALVHVAVTDRDLFEAGKPYIFGLASLTDRTAVLSTARLGEGAAQASRLAKLAAHEVGHALGLHHHHRSDCVMRTDATAASLDAAPSAPCAACADLLATALSKLMRPGQTQLDRVRGYLARGQTKRASRALRRSQLHTLDLAVVRELGRAFFDAKDFSTSIALWTHVRQCTHDEPEATVALALALEQRGDQADLTRAVALLRGVAARTPNWPALIEHLASFERAPQAQGPR